MAHKHTAVLGIYTDYSSVENAVDVLKEAGFRNTDISVLSPQKAGSNRFASIFCSGKALLFLEIVLCGAGR